MTDGTGTATHSSTTVTARSDRQRKGLMQLEGRLALITGGGQGIGRGIVNSFLAEGARVAVVQRRPLAPQLLDHDHVFGIQGDLSDASALPEIVERAAH